MEKEAAVTTLGALAQDTRLAIFRYLVRTGEAGAVVSDIRDEVGIPNATLSFHLSTLKSAGLIRCHRVSRQLIYSVDYEQMRDLMNYLARDCCDGKPEICHGLADAMHLC